MRKKIKLQIIEATRTITALCAALLLLNSCSMSREIDLRQSPGHQSNFTELNALGKEKELDMYLIDGRAVTATSLHIDADSASLNQNQPMPAFKVPNTSIRKFMDIDYGVGFRVGGSKGAAYGGAIGLVPPAVISLFIKKSYYNFGSALALTIIGGLLGLLIGGIGGNSQGYETKFIIN